MPDTTVGAGLSVPVPPEEFYMAVLDVRGFPAWAPGVRQVEVLAGEGASGMLSEWEVSFFGFRRKILSVLQEARTPELLRWTYSGPVTGWGECSVHALRDGTLAEFRTALSPADPLLARLARGNATKNAARAHLRRSLHQLGRLVTGDETRALIGPITPNQPIPPTPKAESGRQAAC